MCASGARRLSAFLEPDTMAKKRPPEKPPKPEQPSRKERNYQRAKDLLAVWNDRVVLCRERLFRAELMVRKYRKAVERYERELGGQS
jgi:hypothetical protein